MIPRTPLGTRSIVAAVLAGWWIVILATVLGAGVGLLARTLAPDTFRATSAVLITTPTTEALPDVVQARIVSARLAQDYASLANSPSVLTAAATASGTGVRGAELVGSVTGSAAQSSPIISVRVTSSEQRVASAVADAVADELTRIIAERNPGAAVNPLGTPYRSVGSALPGPALVGGASGLAGLAVGLLLVVLREARRDRIRGVDDIRAVTEARIVGSVARRYDRGLSRRRGTPELRDTTTLRDLVPTDADHLVLTVVPPDETRIALELVARLAADYAAAGRMVAVLDGSGDPALLRARLHAAPPEAPEAGSSAVVARPCRTAEAGIAYMSLEGGAWVAGAPRAADLWSVVRQLRSQFDVVLAYPGGITPLAPGRHLVGAADCVLVPVAAQVTRRSTLASTVSLITTLGGVGVRIFVNSGDPDVAPETTSADDRVLAAATARPR